MAKCNTICKPMNNRIFPRRSCPHRAETFILPNCSWCSMGSNPTNHRCMSESLYLYLKVHNNFFSFFALPADAIASVILVILPLYALWDTLSLPTTERRLVMVLYTGTVFTLMACIAQTVALVKKNVRAVSYVQNIQVSPRCR